MNIEDTVVGQLLGSEGKEITFGRKSSGIKFKNARIGSIRKGGLVVKDSRTPREVSFINSTVGLFEEESVRIGKKTNLIVDNSNVGFLMTRALDIGEDSKVVIQRSALGLNPGTMLKFNCSSNDAVISDTIVFPFQSSNCSTCLASSIEEFLPSSCQNNRLMNRKPYQDKESSWKNFFHKNETSKIPTGLFYLMIGLCLFLLAIIMILIGIIVFGKFRSRERPQNQDHSSDPEYFAPKMTLDSVAFTTRNNVCMLE